MLRLRSKRKVLCVVEKCLKKNQQPFAYVEGSTACLSFNYRTVYGDIKVKVTDRQEECLLFVNSMLPESVPENKVTDISLFITRANHELTFGAFDFCLDTREVYFRSAMPYDNSVLTPEQVERVLFAGCYAMDIFRKGIIRIVYVNIDPRPSTGELHDEKDINPDLVF